MTEAEWLACADPKKMLACLQGRVSDRKVRLFACACIGEYLRFMGSPHSDTGNLEAALEAYERFANGLASCEEWRRAHENILFSVWRCEEATLEADAAIDAAAGVAAWDRSRHYDKKQEHDELRRLAAFLRCVAGNLFPHLKLDPAWLGWNGRAIPHLAGAIYDERAFDRLPILADALEEAGCTAAAILDHLRGPGPHVRGCWVVDRLLDKE